MLRRVLVVTAGALAAAALVTLVPSPGGPLTAPTAAPLSPPTTHVARSVPAKASPPADAPTAPGPADDAGLDELLATSAALHPAGTPLGVLHGHVVGPDGEPLAGVQVLARSATGGLDAGRTDAEGRYRFVVPEGTVAVHAARWDGLLEARSEEQWVDLSEGQRRYLALDLQSEPAADIGLVAGEAPEGFEVTWAVPGLAAHELGLGPGDVVLGVDGRPAVELTVEELERALVGTADSEVRLDVLIDGERTELIVPRWGLDEAQLAAAEEVVDTAAG